MIAPFRLKAGLQTHTTMPSLRCIKCQSDFHTSQRIYTCSKCSSLLDVVYEVDGFQGEYLIRGWDARRASSKTVDQSGVWRFCDLQAEADDAKYVISVEGLA